MANADDLWDVALDWQTYLEEATAGIGGNTVARAVREELRGHLETERLRALAQGTSPETAARRAMAAMGDVRTSAAALGAQHGRVLWRHASWMGAASGLAAALANGFAAVVLHPMMLRPMMRGERLGVHALSLACLFAPMAMASLWTGRRAGARPVEAAVATMSILGFYVSAYPVVSMVFHMFPGVFLGQGPLVLGPVGWTMLGGLQAAAATYGEGTLLLALAVYALRRAAEALPVRVMR